MKPLRRWASIGDLHVGSRGAPWAPFETKDRSWIYPSPAQEYLLECFHAYWRWVEDTGGCDTVLLGGDLIDGGNPKQKAEDLSSAEMKEQRRNVISMLRPYCEGKKVVSVDGSPYHIGLEQSNDELVAEALGAIYHEKLLFLSVEETGHVVMAYHKGRTGGVYRASALESECRALDVAIGRGDITHNVDICIRFHSHYNMLVRYRHRQMLQCGCFKLWFPGNIGTVGYGDRIPGLGAHVIEFYEDRIEVKDKLFPYYRDKDRLRVA